MTKKKTVRITEDGEVMELVPADSLAKKPEKRPCEGGGPRVVDEIDGTPVIEDVYVPGGRPGADHRFLQGHHRHGIKEAIIKARMAMSDNGHMGRARIRYRPRQVMAYHVESDILENDPPRRVRRSGWLVPGPGGMVFYVSEDQFNMFFEMIDDEPRQ